MPKELLPFQPTSVEKKMQININSEDDAKAVIQHLGKIKTMFNTMADTAGIVSIEFCIADAIRKKVEATLTGAIPWCKTWVKSVMPFEGNVHYPLPHFVPPPTPVKTFATVASPAPKTIPVDVPPAVPAQKPNRYLRNQEAPGKSAPPVQALATEAS